jgi:hypothetical protein
VSHSPYRTGDPSERLGACVSTHKARAGEYVRALLMAPGFLVIGLFAGVRAFDAAERDDWSFAVLASIVATTGLVIAGLVARHLFRLRQAGLEIRQFGVRIHHDKESSMMLWDEIGDIEWAASGRRGRHHVLIARDGRRVVLTDEFTDPIAIARAVEQEVLGRLLPPLRARLEAGEEVSFGPFAASKEGVSHGTRRLAWSLVQRAVLVDGVFAIGAAGRDVVALPKRDGVMAWAKAPIGEVSNAPLLLAIVGEYRGREPSAPPSRRYDVACRSR